MDRTKEYLEKSRYFELMMPPEGAEVIERVNDYIWLDADEILYSVPKEIQKDLTLADAEEQLEEWKHLYSSDKKLNMISVINPHAKSSKEMRDWAAEILPQIVNSLAVINNSALGRMAINLFIGLRPPTYELKVFKDFDSAYEWVKNFVEK